MLTPSTLTVNARTMGVRCLAVLALLQTAAQTQTPLPAATSEAKVVSDQGITLEGTARGGRIVIRDRGGNVVRIVEAGAGLESLRRAEVQDFALMRDGTVAVAFHAILPLGVSARYLGLYPVIGAPRLVVLKDAVCDRVAADELSGVWCIGTNREDGILHRVAGEYVGPKTLYVPKGVRVEGAPQLVSPSPGMLVAWLAASSTLIQWDTATGETRLRQIPLPAAQALVSLSVAPDGAVLALLPLRAAGEAERLDTPYGLFILDAQDHWRRLASSPPSWPRGAALAGPNAVWNRIQRRVDWLH